MILELTKKELERYDRQMRIKGFGRRGQLKLKGSKVLVAGAGGLGCPAALYLAAAGVGHITIVDRERVELSNLNRQVLHWNDDVNDSKSASAAKKLRLLNPDIVVEALPSVVEQKTTRDLIKGCDVVVDGMDNWHTRFLINEACVKEKIPFVHAGVYSTYGQLITIVPGKGPCLRCILPKEPPEKERFPILGAIAGIFGILEIAEAIKLITGFGKPLIGKMIYLNIEDLSFKEISIKRRSDCTVCSSR